MAVLGILFLLHSAISSTVPVEKTLEALKNTDFALFGLPWWLYASFECLQVATLLHILGILCN